VHAFSRCGIAMPAKQQNAKASDDPSVVPENCADIAVALRSACSLPEACRLMLVAGLEHSLGVDPSKRDPGQQIIVDFIGEVLARRRAELATRTECFEANTACAQTSTDENAEVERKADDDVAREASFVAAKRAIFDEDDNQLKQAQDGADAAESARSTTKANLLEMCRERDLCTEGETLTSRGAESGEIKTDELTKSIGQIQALASKLGLEQSLVGILQFLAKKPMDEWTILERAASEMIGGTLAKHLVDLEAKLESGTSSMTAHNAALETAKEKLAAAKERQLASAASLREAESRHSEAESRAKEAKLTAKQSAAELERAQTELADAQAAVECFSEGPMDSFRELNGGSPAIERQAAREVATKCKLNLLHSKDVVNEDPCAKKPRLDSLVPTDNACEVAVC